MTAPVEARSLSSLTQVFANPPQYPRNPTHRPLDSLVLYIVRVPGSKDIFLTPLKPPTKTSISVEAIESSLYYFHVITPEDDVVRKSLEIDRQSREGENSRSKTIHRKPLSSPFSTGQSSDKPREKSTKRRPLPPSDISEIERETASSNQPENVSPLLAAASNHGSLTVPRKPVGPRPLTPRSQTSESLPRLRDPTHGPEKDEVTVGRRQSSEYPKLCEHENNSYRSRGNSCSKVGPMAEALAAFPLHPPPGPSPQRPSSSTTVHEVEQTFNVTVVRRDPASGAQWNVGTLSREQAASPVKDNWLKIQITTPGYQKFAGKPHLGTSTLQASGQGSVELTKDASTKDHAAATSNTSSASAMVLPPQTSIAACFTSEIISTRPSSSRQWKGSHQYHSSSDSLPASLPQPVSSPSQPCLTFNSPWQGICTFATKMDGRSLNCRHQLPTSHAEQRDSSVSIAELRFNLPWSALKSRDVALEKSSGPNSSAHLGGDTRHTFRRGMARIKQEMRSSSSVHPNINDSFDPTSSHDQTPTSTSTLTSIPSTHLQTEPIPELSPRYDVTSDSDLHMDHDRGRDHEPPRLDLKLGRERAGGGRKGKSAKLGKLILKDEGLKMADLVVSACMGVWWDIYDGGAGGGSGGGSGASTSTATAC